MTSAMPTLAVEEELTARMLAQRPARASRMLQALHALAPEAGLHADTGAIDTFDYAVLHHCFERARLGAAGRSESGCRDALTMWQRRATLRAAAVSTAVGAVLVVDSRRCVAVNDSRLASTLHLLPADPPYPGELATGLVEAVDAGLAVGMEVLRTSTAAVIWTDRCGLADHSVSYTLDFLPATVVTSWATHPLRLAETLVHEATHSWLNECLAADEVAVGDGPWLYSPWRGEQRPVYGIIHAALAFAKVIEYLTQVQQRIGQGGVDGEMVAARLLQERASMAEGRESIRQALDYMAGTRIGRYVEAAVEHCAPPA
ncbi:hypothetical protein GCM10010124_06130 [Pilimelia terevasa]|uniref:HEXXH motif domain-containing protein n=1 Tax=Pilimelia terevasa TaxID=53372 RepID=A0A8J3BEX1_9ACTN|nr:HEXXH motif-containing putative peptide modification protein [Pilimelia terevasa]GGK16326.1 hypothetical protein GCM10010124_06130 [Pilimelia terevasa]